ncbi:hypothetical protein [Luteolibacter marinus]|uniref:hypothetical protein n=1 Tax=Luteolibacter marinus TaxID=2776705 RepID=UPI00186726D4|nr:hypothetical protein [Luteolibacter marinus]
MYSRPHLRVPGCTFLAAAVLAPGLLLGGTIRIDFGPNDVTNGNPTTSPDSNGKYWNNVTGNGAVAPGVLASNMVTDDNTPTTLGVRIHPGWSANGIATGGLLAPDAGLLGDLAIDTATQDYFYVGGSEKASMSITGLDPGKLYTFRFFATRAADDVRESQYRITAGSGIASTTLQTSGVGIGDDGVYNGNDDEIAEIADVQADASGQVIVDVSIVQGGFAYVGAMEIVEGAAAPPIVAGADSGRLLIDFGRTNGLDGNITINPDINGNYWNNFVGNGFLPNLLTLENLFTSDYKPTGISLTTGSGGAGGWESNGIRNGGLLAPNPALLGDFAIDTVTQDYFFLAGAGGTASMEISGLDPAKEYTFRMFATRELNTDRLTTYTMHAGNGIQTVDLQTSGAAIGDGGYNGNNDEIVEFTGVQSTTTGTVKLDLTATTGGFCYIGAMEIIVGADAAVIEPPVSTTGTVRIDFGRADGIGANGRPTVSPDVNGNWWNNLIGFGGVPAGRGLYNMVTTDNVPTTIDIVTSSGGWDSNGRNNGGLKLPDGPDAGLLGDFAIESATEDYLFRGGNTGDTSSFTITGLDPDKRYDFRMFATRQNTGVRETTYTITGAEGPVSVDLQTSGPAIGTGGYDGNNDTIAEITGVAPDSSGSAQLDVTILSGGFAYIAILDIIEVSDAPFAITAIEVTAPDAVELTFNSKAGHLYDIQANLDLGTFGSIGQVIASGASTTFTRSGVTLVDREFFRVEDLGVAPPLFSADFESDDGGFTVVDLSSGGTGSDWQHGTPASSGIGGAVTTGSGGSAKCWGTDIGDPGFVNTDTSTSLRSPVIDLTSVTAATLTFSQALDFDVSDVAEVYVIEAGTDTVIAGPIYTAVDDDIVAANWSTVAPIALPPAAFGQSVRLEWRFTRLNTSSDWLGWYVDDVVLDY